MNSIPCRQANTEPSAAVQRNVVVTGFGLFADHQTNVSWEAIRDGRLKIDRPNIKLITQQVEVSYEDVDRAVESIWADLDPLLVVHVGLAAHETAIRIEQLARHGPYIHDDTRKCAPHKHLREHGSPVEPSLEEGVRRRSYGCKPCSFACSSTGLDLDKICEKMNQAFKDGRLALATRKSFEAGLYVCEYIYHRSLSKCDRSVFIHVPDIKSFAEEDIRAALKFAIETMIDEVVTAQ